jgi:nucleoside-diphosphate-sugar epimerase
MRKVLVAGGAGFIGSHLCKKLLEDNYEVVCVDNLLTGDEDNILLLSKNPKFKFFKQDIIDRNNLEEIEDLDFIFNLASPASPNKNSKKSYINYPIETLLVNSVGNYNLLELAKKNRSKFLYASSSEIYGDPEVSPQKEDYFGSVNPNGVRSVYDEGKRFGEAMTFAYVRKYNLDARVVRIFNTYGPLMQVDDGRVVSNFINQALRNEPITVYGNGSQTRSLCFVDDMVLGIKKAMFGDGTMGDIFNLGNPDERSILNIAKLIKNMTGSSSEIVFGELPEDDPKSRKPDIKKAGEVLHWKPEIETEGGLKRTINYFKNRQK